VDSVAGIATLIQSSDDYRRAFDIADSDFFGMEFCCGCWLEGGASFGNILRDIKDFVSEGKVFIVHFRNVSGTLPYFIETFVDDGYQNMYVLMKAFVDSGYTGTLVMDHSPHIIESAGKGAAMAYANGYLRALLQAAEYENAAGTWGK
jgi:mannonate dehydratase